jgi:hypothetical protein
VALARCDASSSAAILTYEQCSRGLMCTQRIDVCSVLSANSVLLVHASYYHTQRTQFQQAAGTAKLMCIVLAEPQSSLQKVQHSLKANLNVIGIDLVVHCLLFLYHTVYAQGLLAHLLQCPQPEQCSVCTPLQLPPQLRELRALNQSMAATATANAAATAAATATTMSAATAAAAATAAMHSQQQLRTAAAEMVHMHNSGSSTANGINSSSGSSVVGTACHMQLPSQQHCA